MMIGYYPKNMLKSKMRKNGRQIYKIDENSFSLNFTSQITYVNVGEIKSDHNIVACHVILLNWNPKQSLPNIESTMTSRSNVSNNISYHQNCSVVLKISKLEELVDWFDRVLRAILDKQAPLIEKRKPV